MKGWGSFLLCLASVAASAENAADWLVEIRSSYTDLKSPRLEPKEFYGAGIVFSDQGSTYILTSSHVSQGKNLKVFYKGSFVATERKIVQVGYDLEILKVRRALPCYWKWDAQTKKFLSKRSYQSKDGALFLKTGLKLAAVNLENASLKGGLALLPNWNNEADFADQDANGLNLSPQYTSATHRFFSLPIAILPGMSGSPLVVPLGSGKSRLELLGLVSYRSRQFRMSYFSSASSIEKFMTMFESGTKGSLDDCRWKLSGNVTYRECRLFKEYIE